MVVNILGFLKIKITVKFFETEFSPPIYFRKVNLKPQLCICKPPCNCKHELAVIKIPFSCSLITLFTPLPLSNVLRRRIIHFRLLKRYLTCPLSFRDCFKKPSGFLNDFHYFVSCGSIHPLHFKRHLKRC